MLMHAVRRSCSLARVISEAIIMFARADHARMETQCEEGTKACGKALVPQSASQKAIFEVDARFAGAHHAAWKCVNAQWA